MKDTNSLSGVASTRAVGAAILVSLVIALALISPSTASAEFIGDLVTIDVLNPHGQDTFTWNPHIPAHAFERIQDALKNKEEFRGDNDELLGTIDSLIIDFDGDPLIDIIFAATAGDEDTTFTITSALVSFDTLTDPIGEASADITLTDVAGSDPGAFLEPVDPATGVFIAEYNDGTLFSELIGTIEFDTAGGTGSEDSSHGPVVIPGNVDSIRGQLSFKLSAGDSVSGHVRFEVTPIPEPSTWAMLAVGAIGLVVCGRRWRRS